MQDGPPGSSAGRARQWRPSRAGAPPGRQCARGAARRDLARPRVDHQVVLHAVGEAAGDAADSKGLPLTPVAVMEGHIVASNIIKGNTKKVSYPPMPSVVFTLPTLAAVGLTEAEAKSQKIEYQVNYNEVGNWFNAERLNVKEYAFKTIVDKEDHTILGAHLIGPNAEETINLFAIAIKTKMRINDLRTMIFSYPTLSSDIPYML